MDEGAGDGNETDGKPKKEKTMNITIEELRMLRDVMNDKYGVGPVKDEPDSRMMSNLKACSLTAKLSMMIQAKHKAQEGAA